MLWGYEISYIVRCLLLHSGFGLLFSAPLWLTLTTLLIRGQSFTTRQVIGLSLVLFALGYLSHLLADVRGLGF